MPSLTYGVRVRRAEQPRRVGLVLGEQQLGRAVAIQPAPAVVWLVESTIDAGARPSASRAAAAVGAVPSHDQRVAEPERRQHVAAPPLPGRGCRRDADQDVFGDALAYSTKTSK